MTMRLRSSLIPAAVAGLVAAVLLLVPGPASAQSAQPRIVGGSNVTIESYPYTVRLLIRVGSSTYSCGGSIRDATHIITAAHCVTFESVVVAPNALTVRYGSANTGTQLSAAVSRVSVYSDYVNGDDSYDAALLELSAPLSGYGQGKANPIPIASAGTVSTGTTTRATAFATGWGTTTENGTTSPNLQGVALKLEPDAYCTPTYGTSYVGQRTVCAGGDGTAAANNPDTCQGDSGGPLALNSGSGYELVGITSYGIGCGRRLTPAAYTDPSNPEIYALIQGTAPASRVTTTSGLPSAPAPVTAPVVPAPRAKADTVRPTARISSLRCKRHRCSIAFRAADKGGSIRRLSATVKRRVRVCRHGWCKTVTKTKRLRLHRTSTGFATKAALTPAVYRLEAVATDTAGNRSVKVTKRFRVKR